VPRAAHSSAPDGDSIAPFSAQKISDSVDVCVRDIYVYIYVYIYLKAHAC